MNKYLMTQSLLSAWSYIYSCAEGQEDAAYQSFVKTLNREQTETTEAMRNGIDFENEIMDLCNGIEVKNSRFGNTVKDIASIVKGGQFQVVATKEKTICGIDFLLYAKCDVVKAGTIYDIKFSKSYEIGKYLTSPQHPMYFECIPCAKCFEYLISDGIDVYSEFYSRDNVQSIDFIISEFLNNLKGSNNLNTYFEKWQAK